MKSFYVFLLFPLFIQFSYAQFTDNFSDGDFKLNPTWKGDTNEYQITTNELQLNAPAVSNSKYLSTPSKSIDMASWEFKIRMSFNPSSSNFAKIYLVSNSANLSNPLKGYFVKIGSSNDEISLYSQSGSTETKIIDGRNGVVNTSSVNATIKVTRTTSGLWELFSDTSSSSSSYISEGTITDNSHILSDFFGVSCTFTSTRSNKFFFDDFIVSGTAAIDSIKPTLDSIKVISNTQLQLVFSEPIDLSSSQNINNYLVNYGIGNPISATRNSSDSNKVSLIFSSSFPSGVTHQLKVKNIVDLASNKIDSTSKDFLFFIPASASYRDIVINEILADPTPTIGLPQGECIELYNSSNSKVFDIKDWKFSDGTSTSSLPSYILKPNSYVILFSSTSSGNFSSITNKLSVTSFPSLNNSGETLELKDDLGNSIDKIEYSISMYDNSEKTDGGWSLEQINPILTCYNPKNWKASTNNNGGTPGSLNSIYDISPDIQNPLIISGFAIKNNQIELTLNEPIDTLLISNSTCSVSGGISITNIHFISGVNTKLIIDVTPFIDTGKEYTITIDSLKDCSGNITSSSFTIILPNANKSGSIIINELLFDPYPGDEDFVELYNNSSLYIDLYGWKLGNDVDGIPGNIKTITTHYLLKPNEYVVVTKSYSLIKARYWTHSQNNFIEIEALPTYSNEEGTAYILTPTNEESDKFYYQDSYHFKLLKEKEGVSLERLDFNRETSESSNWHSAASTVGFATPGLPNSQYNPAILSQETVSLSPELFSPDNDGHEDVLSISYSLDEIGFVGSFTIYDSKGRLVKNLINNELLNANGVIIWDGTNNNNTKARIGTYLILFEFFDLNGNKKILKKTCVIGHKL